MTDEPVRDEFAEILAMRYADLPKAPLPVRVANRFRRRVYWLRRVRMLSCRTCHGHGMQPVYTKKGELIYVVGRPCVKCGHSLSWRRG